ncbi:MAG: hypothetical protein O7B99_04350 [Planctomycetota bacterium]|nr:hypothetical protein [Planctomycetota bacterium]
MNPYRRSLLALWLVVGLLAVGGAAFGQAPKPGKYYTDDTDLGFEVKMPKDWGFFPPKPGDVHRIGKFDGPSFQLSPLTRLDLTGTLVKFDRRPDADGKPKKLRYKDPQAWIRGNLDGKGWSVVSEKDLKAGRLVGKELVFQGDYKGAEVRAYAGFFALSEDVDVALVFNGPGERKWSKYEKAYRRLAKTFRRTELVEAAAEPTGVGSGSVRARKRAKLQDEANRTPGWQLLETENYFIITNSDDDGFIEELMDRVEAIREVYVLDYPPSKARMARRSEDDEEAGDGESETASAAVDPMELSRTSVVRVCANRDDYLGYGAPPSSGGYWSPSAQELVVYNKKQQQGEDATWETLSHEAFHQYIFYFYGSLSPHSWYNEGTGDYYGGHEYKRKKFKRAPRQSRKETIRKLVREERTVSLEEFVRWTKQQYYGSNSYGLSGFECYGQGWSLIYFLRMGKKVRGWNDDWDSILDVYLDTLADTADLDEAVDAAFAGVDWEELESTWLKFCDKQL